MKRTIPSKTAIKKAAIQKAAVKKIAAKKTAAKKATAKKAVIAQRLPSLSLWSDINFSGRRLRFRGNIGVRSLVVFNYNDVLSSFEVDGTNQSTLVLFQDANYQGARRVFRGSTAIANLGDFNDLASSFVLSRGRLSDAQINRIQNRGTAPANFAEVFSNGVLRRSKSVK
ncbi:peptidase inhibitor family I36 protein [Paenibacillus sp. GYB004]|uniref:peptidase inhibitor family I36 protein n=1 Tax=Paenibacillus sp. GYB004 TaxID=2994393 RepID=UPI002F96DA79